MYRASENLISREVVEIAHGGAVNYIRFTPQQRDILPEQFFQLAAGLINETVLFLRNDHREWKIHPVLLVRFYKWNAEDDSIVRTTQYFSLPAIPCMEYNQEDVVQQLCEQISKFISKGSGWLIDEIIYFDLRICRYNSIRHKAGHGYSFDLPERLRVKKACVNVQNVGDDCFRYALLSVLHYNDVDSTNRNRANQYDQWLDEHNWSGIEFPMTAGQLKRFERQNPGLTINLLEWIGNEKDSVHRIRTAPKTDKEPVNILCVKMRDEKYHYVGVTSLDRLLSSRDEQHKYCPWCFKPLQWRTYDSHFPCQGDVTSVRPPKDRFVQFKEYAKTQELTYIIYADCECYIEKVSEAESRHVPCAIGLLLVPHPAMKHCPLQIPYTCFVGDNCIEKAMDWIETVARRVYAWNKQYSDVRIEMTKEDYQQFHRSTNCYVCNVSFTEEGVIKIREHCHLSGRYRGAACQKCNFKMRLNRITLPIFFHNFRGYDAHILCSAALGKKKEWELGVIPQTKERYTGIYAAFDVDVVKAKEDSDEEKIIKMKLQFKDSAQFLLSSLDNLVRNLQPEQLCNTTKAFPDMDITAKGIFPYEWFDSIAKLDETSLPSIDCFYDTLNNKSCTNEEYQRALDAWSTLKCQTFHDYMCAYLKMDVHQLADVFEAFRRLAVREDNLDPAYYYTIPGLSWSSAFKLTKTQVDLLQDLDMYAMFEKGIRGGFTFVNEHHVQANIPGQESYTQLRPHTEMAYIDANNLYGHALSMALPQTNFEWLNNDECLALEQTIKTLDLQKDTGYLLEVDLEYPASIHDETMDLPFCPEKMKLSDEYLSDFMRLQLQSAKYKPTEKLLLTQWDKEKYVVHGRLLQFYLNHGMILKKIHRAITFTQSPFFEPYITYNSQKRQMATTSFEKDFYKLKNNSLYGKTVENIKKRLNFRLCHTEEHTITYTSNPSYQSSIIFNPDLVGITLAKETIELNKPIYIGQAVLDLAKLVMYELFYDRLKPYESIYPGSTIRAIGGDTDSLMLCIENIDVQKEFYPRLLNDQLLDTSNYPNNHALFTESNKAKLGFVKDEAAGRQHSEWILLRPKAYSLLLCDDVNIKRAKGVRSVVVKNVIRHGDYKSIYDNQSVLTCDQTRIASHNHTLSTISYSKKSLCIFEDKRCWLSKNISYPYGHYSLNQSRPTVKRNFILQRQPTFEVDDDEEPTRKRHYDDDDMSDFIVNDPCYKSGKEFKKRRIHAFFDLEAGVDN